MIPCTAREFVQTNGRKGSTSQFAIVQRATEWGLKADVWATDVTCPGEGVYLARDYAMMAAQLAFIAFSDLR